MKTYYVEYYTQSGQRVGIQIQAINSTEAAFYARKLPDFACLVTMPREI